MKILSVICEFDPFHNGHAYLLSQARQKSGAEYTVCIMSGCVTQRGMFSRYDKRLRAKAALLHGADLVIELPVRFSCAGADDFAAGGIALASALGDEVCLGFGCEGRFLPFIQEFAGALRSGADLTGPLKQALAEGLSYPAAMSRALTDLFPQFPALDSPNALLALSYLSHLPSSIQPIPIERTGCGYHELRPSPLASASFIRQAMKEGKYDLAASALPEAELFLEAEKEKDICTEDALDTALLFHLRSISPSDLSGIAGVCEGLENRILSCARRACSRDELLALCKTKRYTWTRLSRICTCALLGMTNQDLQDYPSPQYLRVLGFRRQALPLLHAISKRSALPLVTRACDAPAQSRLFSLDQRAQDLWSLGCSCKGARQAGRDLRSSCVIV